MKKVTKLVNFRAFSIGISAALLALACGSDSNGGDEPAGEDQNVGGEEENVTPVRETCADNPLLAGCDLPETDSDDSPLTPEPTEPPPSLGDPEPDSEEEGPAPSPGAAGAAAGDAGADDTPADAGAP